MTTIAASPLEPWPSLPLEAWADTYATLHLWTQIAGKVRLAAFYSNDLHEFILPYDAVRQAESPDGVLLDFLQSTYEAAANLAQWDRSSLEYDHDPSRGRRPGVSRGAR